MKNKVYLLTKIKDFKKTFKKDSDIFRRVKGMEESGYPIWDANREFDDIPYEYFSVETYEKQKQTTIRLFSSCDTECSWDGYFRIVEFYDNNGKFIKETFKSA